MHLPLKSLLATAALAIASTSAMATNVTIPASGPVNDPTLTSNGPLTIAAWNTSTGASVVEWLGLNFNDVQPGGAFTSSTGASYDFGTLGGFASLGPSSQIKYEVFAANGNSTGFSGVAGTSFLITGASTLTDVVGASVSGATVNVTSYVSSVWNTPGSCQNANPCIGSSSGDFKSWLYGPNNTGPTIGGAFPDSSAALAGNALSFYRTVAPESDDGNDFASVTKYQNGAGAGSWLLDTNGHLTYSLAAEGTGTPVVPLPAAVWLLFSGIAGLRLIGRRRDAAAVAA